jgi:hypothetical protein
MDKLKRFQSLQAFKDHVQQSMPTVDADDSVQEAFYKLDWTISFNGQTIAIDNFAAIYNGMLEVIDDILCDY